MQQRILVEHYSRVLAERLVRQQVAINAAAAASGRTLEFATVAVQTSAAVGATAPAPVFAARTASCTSVARGGTAVGAVAAEASGGGLSVRAAGSSVSSGAAGEGAAMGAALLRRDGDAFHMLLDALHSLPRPWLLSLPPRLLRVLAGEVRLARVWPGTWPPWLRLSVVPLVQLHAVFLFRAGYVCHAPALVRSVRMHTRARPSRAA